MDRVKLGRVLGRGARMAARTVVDAVDAASSPASKQNQTAPRMAPPRQQPVTEATAETRSTLRQAVRTAGQVQGSVRTAHRGVLAPVKRASRAVSLEIAGSFFALFALSFSAAAWRFRDAAPGGAVQRLWIYLAFAALFGYFAVSSFLRARRITRG